VDGKHRVLCWLPRGALQHSTARQRATGKGPRGKALRTSVTRTPGWWWTGRAGSWRGPEACPWPPVLLCVWGGAVCWGCRVGCGLMCSGRDEGWVQFGLGVSDVGFAICCWAGLSSHQISSCTPDLTTREIARGKQEPDTHSKYSTTRMLSPPIGIIATQITISQHTWMKGAVMSTAIATMFHMQTAVGGWYSEWHVLRITAPATTPPRALLCALCSPTHHRAHPLPAIDPATPAPSTQPARRHYAPHRLCTKNGCSCAFISTSTTTDCRAILPSSTSTIHAAVGGLPGMGLGLAVGGGRDERALIATKPVQTALRCGHAHIRCTQSPRLLTTTCPKASHAQSSNHAKSSDRTTVTTHPTGATEGGWAAAAAACAAAATGRGAPAGRGWPRRR